MGAETAYKRSLAASLDTGTETIIGPKDVVNTINFQLPIVERTATGVEVMCDNIHQLPNITFVFGNYGATISYKEYIKIVYRKLGDCVYQMNPRKDGTARDPPKLFSNLMSSVLRVDSPELTGIKPAPQRLQNCLRSKKETVHLCPLDVQRRPSVWSYEDYSAEGSLGSFDSKDFAQTKYKGSVYCYSAFEHRSTEDMNIIVLGIAFLRNFFTVFDQQDMRIGLSRTILSICFKVVDPTEVFDTVNKTRSSTGAMPQGSDRAEVYNSHESSLCRTFKHAPRNSNQLETKSSAVDSELLGRGARSKTYLSKATNLKRISIQKETRSYTAVLRAATEGKLFTAQSTVPTITTNNVTHTYFTGIYVSMYSSVCTSIAFTLRTMTRDIRQAFFSRRLVVLFLGCSDKADRSFKLNRARIVIGLVVGVRNIDNALRQFARPAFRWRTTQLDRQLIKVRSGHQ
ncbi:hypothetical protein CLF_112432 [Clonorchis sinensis]|uniref:Peptidase A1 domain-containing protein n=1 Tax=Clonorchis sinensis TaxID=79923 RepID=G7YWD6_CLOSI|nr:hypothetical protein CLF_112432 [Clonorchis sinensis]